MSVSSRSRSGRYSVGGSSFSSFIRKGNPPRAGTVYYPSYYNARSVSSISSRSRRSSVSRSSYRRKARRGRRSQRRRRGAKWRPFNASELWLHFTPEARKIKLRSARFVEYYAQASNSADLDAFICRNGLITALDGLACLVTQAPYNRYIDLEDDLKQKVRGVWYAGRLRGLQHTFEMLQPGRIALQRLEKATARKATIEQIKTDILSRCTSSTIGSMGVPVSLQSALAFAHQKTSAASTSSRTAASSAVDGDGEPQSKFPRVDVTQQAFMTPVTHHSFGDGVSMLTGNSP